MYGPSILVVFTHLFMQPSKAASVYPTINTAAVISMVARNPPDAEQECSEGECLCAWVGHILRRSYMGYC